MHFFSVTISPMSSGYDSPAGQGLKLFQLCMEEFGGSENENKSNQSRNDKVVFNLSMYDPDQTRRLTCPAPPPKIHFSTLWKSVTKRLWCKHSDHIKIEAKEAGLRLRNGI
jgi:hypothetical protein